MRHIFIIGLCLSLPACQAQRPEPSAPASGDWKDMQVFEIEGETAPCTGAVPMQCLVVNGEYFYEPIQGYVHNPGIGARICVERRQREKPIPADAGLFTYHRTACPAPDPATAPAGTLPETR